MGKATEALHDIEMDAGILKYAMSEVAPLRWRFCVHSFEETHAITLRGNVLDMLERHQQKRTFGHRHHFEVSCIHRPPRCVQREGIVSKGGGRSTVHVARKLVEGNHERYARSRRVLPGAQLTMPRRGDRGSKALPNLRIE